MNKEKYPLPTYTKALCELVCSEALCKNGTLTCNQNLLRSTQIICDNPSFLSRAISQRRGKKALNFIFPFHLNLCFKKVVNAHFTSMGSTITLKVFFSHVGKFVQHLNIVHRVDGTHFTMRVQTSCKSTHPFIH